MNPMNVFIILAGAAIAYFIGSVDFAVIVSQKLCKDDVRTKGSGNAGMTNMLRSYRKLPAALTAAGDFLKAIISVALVRWLFTAFAVPFDGGYVAGIAVILGHLYPIYFGFKGGKGVVTSLGVVLMMNPLVFAALLIFLLPVVFTVRIVSLTVLIGYALHPVFTVLSDVFVRKVPTRFVWIDLCFALIISLIGTYVHRANIRRLREGKEYRFGSKKS